MRISDWSSDVFSSDLASALLPSGVLALKPWSLYCTSWPIFSSRVICLSSASTRRAICGEASCALGRMVALGDRSPWPGEAPAVEAATAPAEVRKTAVHEKSEYVRLGLGVARKI